MHGVTSVDSSLPKGQQKKNSIFSAIEVPPIILVKCVLEFVLKQDFLIVFVLNTNSLIYNAFFFT